MKKIKKIMNNLFVLLILFGMAITMVQPVTMLANEQEQSITNETDENTLEEEASESEDVLAAEDVAELDITQLERQDNDDPMTQRPVCDWDPDCGMGSGGSSGSGGYDESRVNLYDIFPDRVFADYMKKLLKVRIGDSVAVGKLSSVPIIEYDGYNRNKIKKLTGMSWLTNIGDIKLPNNEIEYASVTLRHRGMWDPIRLSIWVDLRGNKIKSVYGLMSNSEKTDYTLADVTNQRIDSVVEYKDLYKIQNEIFGDGLITPTEISHGGVYKSPYIAWDLPNKETTVYYKWDTLVTDKAGSKIKFSGIHNIKILPSPEYHLVYPVQYYDGKTPYGTSTLVQRGTKFLEPKQPTKEGHTFIGWYTEEGVKWDFSSMEMPLKPLNLYARFKDGQGEPLKISEVFPDKKLADFIREKVNKQKHEEFVTLTELANVTELKQGDRYGLGIESLSGIELLPNLRILSFPNNSITEFPNFIHPHLESVDLSGNRIIDVSHIQSMQPTKTTYNFKNQGRGKAVPYRDSHTLENEVKGNGLVTPTYISRSGTYQEPYFSWNISNSNDSYSYKWDTIVSKGENLDIEFSGGYSFNIKWSPLSELVYELQYYSDDVAYEDVSHVNYGDKLIEPVTPEKEHHTFIGWYTDKGEQWDFETMTMPLRPLNLYAKFLAHHQAFFYVDEDEVKNEWVKPGDAVSKPEDPTKEGYTFIGWYTEDGEKWDFETDSMPAEALSLHARFVKNYRVAFQGDKGIVGDQWVAFGAKIIKPTEIPTKPGHVFVGWYNIFGDGELWDFENDTMPEEDMLLVARFVPDTYIIVLVDKVNKSVKIIDVTYGEAAPEPILIASTGEIFLGWYTEDGEQWDFSTNTMPPDNLILYARWGSML